MFTHFFVLSLIWFVMVCITHQPFMRLAPMVFVSFIIGWWTGELALHWIVLWVGICVWYIAHGALSDMYGVWGVVFHIAACAGLWLHFRKGGKVRSQLERALWEGLSPHVPSLREEDVILPETIPWTSLAFPFWMAHQDVERLRNVPYHEVDGKTLKVEIFRHKERPQGAPILLQIHGGGWVVGHRKQQGLPIMNMMASQGWLCVSVSYRLAPAATFPDPILDLKHAVAWLREHAHEYGGDPNYIAVTGGSAGGHLSALLALTPNLPALQPGFEDADTSIQACVPLYGVYDLLDEQKHWPNIGLQMLLRWVVIKRSVKEARALYELTSPATHISQDAPPFFVLQGDTDSMVPSIHAKWFAQTLGEVSQSPCVQAQIAGAQHAFDFFLSRRTVRVNQATSRFLQLMYQAYLDGHVSEKR